MSHDSAFAQRLRKGACKQKRKLFVCFAEFDPSNNNFKTKLCHVCFTEIHAIPTGGPVQQVGIRPGSKWRSNDHLQESRSQHSSLHARAAGLCHQSPCKVPGLDYPSFHRYVSEITPQSNSYVQSVTLHWMYTIIGYTNLQHRSMCFKVGIRIAVYPS